MRWERWLYTPMPGWNRLVNVQRVVKQILLLVAAGMLAEHPGLAGTIQGRVRSAISPGDLSNFVISVEDIEGRFPVPEQPAIMDQKGLRFDPHVFVIQVGTTVEFPNSDPVSHNVFSISDAKRFNLGLYTRGAVRRLVFDKPGIVELLCNVHLEMYGYIVVVKNPYFAQTASAGTFRIDGVPAGRHRLSCWHERSRVQERTVEVPETGSVTVEFSAVK
jgi:plastocyanin